MNKANITIFLLFIFAVSGCVTHPGNLEESDFVSKSLQLEVPVTYALSTFYDGLRYCGPESGGVVFVTLHGVPECAPIRPDGSAVCDLYVRSAYGGRSNLVLGRADFTPKAGATSVTFRVQSFVGNKERILTAWEMFAKGEAKKVCPK
jgi:hypothetical protein